MFEITRGLILAVFIFLAHVVWADSVVYLDTDRLALQARVDTLLDENVQEVNLASYIFRRDRVGLGAVGMAHALALKGVKVRILLDYYETREGFYSITPEILKFLSEAGVEVKYYHKFSKWDYFNPIAWFRRINPRMHEKILTVKTSTEHMAIVGGRNISTNYFYLVRERRPEQKFNQFLDRDIFVQGDSARSSSERFMELWNSSEVEVAQVDPLVSVSASFREQVSELVESARRLRGTKNWKNKAIHVEQAEVLKDPVVKLGFLTGVTQQIIEAINQAKSSIIIHGPYVLLTRDVENAFLEARNRGVVITIVTAASDNNDMAIVAPEFERDLPKLLNMGINVYQINTFKNFHSKALVVDEKTVFVGSMNFDSRSQRFNTEIMYKITEPNLAEQVIKDTELLKSMSLHRVSTEFPKEWLKVGAKNSSQGAVGVSSQRVGFRCDWVMRVKSFILRPLL